MSVSALMHDCVFVSSYTCVHVHKSTYIKELFLFFFLQI